MIFAKEEVNTGRQLCIDFAKVFAIVFMVLSHVFGYTVIAGVCILLASILLVRVKPFSDMKV